MAQKKLFSFSISVIALFASFFILKSSCALAAIFGVDDRKPITSFSPVYSLAQATAVAVLNSNYSRNQFGNIDLNTSNLDRLCKNELFYNEPSLSYSCTGFLVGPDLLVTAGHCMYAVNSPNQELKNETEFSCPVFDWLFDYESNTGNIVQTKNIPSDRLYHCKKIIYAVQKESAPYSDYALIQLDRPVKGRTPLKLSSSPVNKGSLTFMIGHPFGTPTKLTDHGQVILNNLERASFVTNLDAFEGNSGSPVFNSENEVIGILVSGTPSANTYWDNQNKCERFNRCNEDGSHCMLPDKDTSFFPGFQITGSDVQKIAPLVELVKQSQQNQK